MTGDELDRAIQFLIENQAKLTSDVAKLASGNGQQRLDLTELKKVMAQFAGSTALWAQQTDERIRRLEEIVQEIGAGMRQLTVRTDQLVVGMDQLTARMDQLAARMDQLAARMDQLTLRMDEMAGSMNALIHVIEGHVTDDRRHRPRPGQ